MESEKKKLASKKKKSHLHEKIEVDAKYRSGSDDSLRSYNNKSNAGFMDSIYHIRSSIAKKKQVNKNRISYKIIFFFFKIFISLKKIEK